MQHSNTAGCILLKFYIKPQHTANVYNLLYVVSYRNSTSNHNTLRRFLPAIRVVSYRNSTSNHNKMSNVKLPIFVVSYRNSTSNHNCWSCILATILLYLIEILHQTTTKKIQKKSQKSCILSKFYIKPQHKRFFIVFRRSCILSKFYIKPQHTRRCRHFRWVVSYRNSTSNHNSGRTF